MIYVFNCHLTLERLELSCDILSLLRKANLVVTRNDERYLDLTDVSDVIQSTLVNIWVLPVRHELLEPLSE